MEKELLEQLDGYNNVLKEIEFARKYGSDFSIEKGEVEKYISRLHPTRIDLIVNDIIVEAESIKTLRLVSESGYLPPFQAGQYISINLKIDHIKTNRAFSISSPPNETGFYDITVRRVENGLVSNYLLDEIGVGDKLVGSGPQGTFHYNPIIHDDFMVCLAGGIGITPFISMVREVAQCRLNRYVILIYGSRTVDVMAFHEELSRIADNKNDMIDYVPVIEQPTGDYNGKTGYITAELIKEVCGNIENKSFFICGPQAMYDFCIPELEKLNISRRKIRREMYGMPLNVWESDGWPKEVTNESVFTVKINGTDSIQAPAGVTLLTTLEKNGFLIPSICRSGECSMCRIKVDSGKVFQPAGTPVRKSDRQFGYIHSCASYPLEDLEIVL